MRSISEVAGADYKTESGRQLLDQHFPEKRWQAKSSSFWVMISLLGFFGLGCLAAVIFINDLSARIIFTIMAVLLGLGITVVFKRHHKTQLILNAGGLYYTGWTRPLRFEEVQSISAQRIYSNIVLTFHLKAKQPPIRKSTLFRLPSKKATLSLSGLEGKPLPTAQTICNYFTRQTEQ